VYVLLKLKEAMAIRLVVVLAMLAAMCCAGAPLDFEAWATL
jgi:hypothetical protein